MSMVKFHRYPDPDAFLNKILTKRINTRRQKYRKNLYSVFSYSTRILPLKSVRWIQAYTLAFVVESFKNEREFMHNVSHGRCIVFWKWMEGGGASSIKSWQGKKRNFQKSWKKSVRRRKGGSVVFTDNLIKFKFSFLYFHFIFLHGPKMKKG